MSLAAECLASVTGLWPGKAAPSAHDRLAATGLLDRWRSKLTKWLRHPEQVAPFDWPEPPDPEDLREKVMRPIEPDEDERLVSMTGDYDLGREYVNVLQAGRNFLNERWPKIPVPGMSGELFPISNEELANVWNATRVLDDQDALLDEIAAYSVTVTMINAWKAIYPELATVIVDMLDGIDGLLVEHHADGKKLTWQQEDILKMLIGRQREEVPQGKQDEQDEQQQKQDTSGKGTSKAVEHATKGDFRP